MFSEVMFDAKNGISGEIPEHIEWIYGTAIPKLQEMGVRVDVVRSEIDYLHWFSYIQHKGKYKGKAAGFAIGGKCIVNRVQKIGPIKEYIGRIGDDITQYIGIAVDEPKRLLRLCGNKISLLLKYGKTEKDAYKMCQDAGLLSPIYKTSCRGGCWFCPNVRMKVLKEFVNNHPELWERLLALGKTPNLISYGYKWGATIEEIDAKIKAMNKQLTFDF